MRSRFPDDHPTFLDLGRAQARHEAICGVLGLDPDQNKHVIIHVNEGGAYAEWDGGRTVTQDEVNKIVAAVKAAS